MKIKSELHRKKQKLFGILKILMNFLDGDMKKLVEILTQEEILVT